MHNFQALGVVGALIKLFVVMDATGEHNHGMTGFNNALRWLNGAGGRAVMLAHCF